MAQAKLISDFGFTEDEISFICQLYNNCSEGGPYVSSKNYNYIGVDGLIADMQIFKKNGKYYKALQDGGRVIFDKIYNTLTQKPVEEKQ
jgi:hypothetical protein